MFSLTYFSLMEVDNRCSAGMNGFGRFGLHLLRYWLDRSDQASFRIDFINDDFLTPESILDIILSDKYVHFKDYDIRLHKNRLLIENRNTQQKQEIEITNAKSDQIPWLGSPDIFLECSGKHTDATTCNPFLTGKTKRVIISATSENADQTLVFGFNHETYLSSAKTISYGSCTVNAYVALAHFIDSMWGIMDSDVTVIHNLPEYKLVSENQKTLIRKSCTLEKSATRLLKNISEENFIVNYSLVPFSGASSIDMRFRLATPITRELVVEQLSNASQHGSLKDLYQFIDADRGPEEHICSPFNASFVLPLISVRGQNLYLYGYFDNENSVNRYFDLVNHLTTVSSL